MTRVEKIADYIRENYEQYQRFYTPSLWDATELVAEIDGVRIYEQRNYEYIDIIGLDAEEQRQVERLVKQQVNLDRTGGNQNDDD